MSYFALYACDVLCTTYKVLVWWSDRLHASTLPYVFLYLDVLYLVDRHQWKSSGRRENEVAQDDCRVGRSLGTKISSREQGIDFDPVGTSRKVVICETREATRTTCCQVLLLQGVHQFKSPWHSRLLVVTCWFLSSRSLYLMYWWMI
jgi:hypothetical protein